MSGYSKTPLAKKLGIKPGYNIKLVNPPPNYADLFSDLPGELNFNESKKGGYQLVHFFTRDPAELAEVLPQLIKEIVPAGIVWVSWPKKSAKTGSLVTEDMIRGVGLKSGLVDIKVCAVDDVWSGLKFVIPVKERNKPK